MAIGAVLICVIAVAAAWIAKSTQSPPTAAYVSPQRLPNPDYVAPSRGHIDAPGPGKSDGAAQGAATPRKPTILPPVAHTSAKDIGKMPMPFSDPTAWIRKLPEERQREVRRVFKEHADCVRQRSGGGPLSTEIDEQTMQRMHRVMQDCDHELKGKMKAVLSANEHQQFLDSLPSARLEGRDVMAPLNPH